MKKLDKFFKYLFIVLGVMCLLYIIEMLFFHFGCYDYPNSNLRGKICGSLITTSNFNIHKLLGISYGLLLLLNLPYFIYLLIRKNGLNKSFISFLIYSFIIIVTMFVSIITNVIAL
ncbi:MAG: hypothetical protein Q4E69_07065 [Bacilli bacterium]|nr:hypothetical protein [Bacilli bacterium]